MLVETAQEGSELNDMFTLCLQGLGVCILH